LLSCSRDACLASSTVIGSLTCSHVSDARWDASRMHGIQLSILSMASSSSSSRLDADATPCCSASVCSFPFLTCKNVSHMVRIIIIRLQRLPRQYLELSYMCSLFGSEIASTAVVSQLLLFCPSSPGSLGHIICTVRTHHAFMHELNLTVPSKTNVFF
jgi:hypothetical protein